MDDAYRDRLASYDRMACAEGDRSRWHSRLRLAAAALALTALVLVVRTSSPWAAGGLAFGVVLFLWLVVRHDRIERRREAALALVALGYRSLSVAPSAVGPVKAMLLDLDAGKAGKLIGPLIDSPAASVPIRERLKAFAAEQGLQM